ncbi:MAG: MBL fold metallo-hydrolase [Gemmatimonadaceae bacterium]
MGSPSRATNVVNVGYDSTNYYVLGQGANRLLIDIGWPGTLAKLEAQLKRKDVRLRDIAWLLATHYHPDHAGAAQELKHAGTRLIVIDLQRSAIPTLKTWMKPSNQYQDINEHDNTELSCAASRAFLQSLGIPGEVVPTPGHSDDSVSVVLDDGAVFTGDLTLPGMADENAYDTVRRSWELLRSKGATQVHPGHGPAPRPMPPIPAA